MLIYFSQVFLIPFFPLGDLVFPLFNNILQFGEFSFPDLQNLNSNSLILGLILIPTQFLKAWNMIMLRVMITI